MNWDLLLPLLISTVTAIAGWIIAHRLAVASDLQSKKREIRLRFLLDAYRRLEAGASRGSISGTEFSNGFESAVADIQLLGSSEQSAMARQMAMDIAAQNPNASAGPLLLSLRNELRRELHLASLANPPFHFRLK